MERQLLQCRTCGSQAFHILDCCRNPDYVRVPTSPLGERLKAWLGMVRAWLVRPHPRAAQPASPAALDAWEVRPLRLSSAEHIGASRKAGTAKAVEEVEHEVASAHR